MAAHGRARKRFAHQPRAKPERPVGSGARRAAPAAAPAGRGSASTFQARKVPTVARVLGDERQTPRRQAALAQAALVLSRARRAEGRIEQRLARGDGREPFVADADADGDPAAMQAASRMA